MTEIFIWYRARIRKKNHTALSVETSLKNKKEIEECIFLAPL